MAKTLGVEWPRNSQGLPVCQIAKAESLKLLTWLDFVLLIHPVPYIIAKTIMHYPGKESRPHETCVKSGLERLESLTLRISEDNLLPTALGKCPISSHLVVLTEQKENF